MRPTHRSGFTLVELLVVIGIVLILVSLLMPAVGAARAAARRMVCSNTSRELAMALMLYHDAYRVLPPGTELLKEQRPYQGWFGKVLPYVERQELYARVEQAFQDHPNPFDPVFHPHMVTPVYAFACPEDQRNAETVFAWRKSRQVATTGYQGNAGQNSDLKDGVLFGGSKIRFADIHDGQSQTLLFGERPPSPLNDYGWWYAGTGTSEGALDHTLGLAETHVNLHAPCSSQVRMFQPGNIWNECDAAHFWSLHGGGGHFARADGSISFYSYSGEEILIPLSTRDEGEIVPRD